MTIKDFKKELLTIIIAQTVLFVALIISFTFINIISADYFVYARLRLYFETTTIELFNRFIQRTSARTQFGNNIVTEPDILPQRFEETWNLPPTYSEVTEQDRIQTSRV